VDLEERMARLEREVAELREWRSATTTALLAAGGALVMTRLPTTEGCSAAFDADER
jgi:hypothetical protein